VYLYENFKKKITDNMLSDNIVLSADNTISSDDNTMLSFSVDNTLSLADNTTACYHLITLMLLVNSIVLSAVIKT
jgi:hypothetical protein